MGSTAVGLLSVATYKFPAPKPQQWSSNLKGQGWCGGKSNPTGYFAYMSTDEIYNAGYSLIYAN